MVMTKSKTLIKSAVLLGVATALSKILGFAVEIAVSALFGTGAVADAFILAYSIPNTLLALLAAAIGVSFIPMYHRVDNKVKFSQNIMTCLLVIGLLFSIIFTFFPNALIRLFAFQIASETFEIATFFVRYMVWSAAFILLSYVYDAHLQISGAFFSSGIQHIWRKVSVILGLVLGVYFDFNLIIALAPVVGNILCLLFLAYKSYKNGYIYKPYLNIRSPELKQVIILVAPIFLVTATSQIDTVISRNFAASLPVGSIAHLHFSSTLAGLFIHLFGHVFVTVLFPHLSKLASDNNIERLKNATKNGFIYVTAIMLPLSIGVFALAEPGVRIAFERGLFTAEDTLSTAAILKMMAPYVYLSTIGPIIVRAFYAVCDTKTPSIVAITQVILTIVLNFLLIGPLGARGLALATTLRAVSGVWILFVVFRKKFGKLGLRNNLSEFIKISLATGLMGGSVLLAAHLLPLMTAPLMQSILLCCVIIVGAMIMYGMLLLLMRSKTAREVVDIVRDYAARKQKTA